MYRLAPSDSPSSPSPGTTSSRTTEACDSDSSSPGQYPAAIWSSATLAFHPTGSASSCGSLFNGSAGGGHHHYQSSCSASNAMAYLKSNPYAMAGITTPDLLHSGYPGEFLPLPPSPVCPVCYKRLNSSKCSGDGFPFTTIARSAPRNYRKQGISVRGSKSMHASPAANCRRTRQSLRQILLLNLIPLFHGQTCS